MQIAVVPDNVPALTGAVTVTSLVADALEHPPEPNTVYVIVAVPADTPVTTPVVMSTLAIAVFELVQDPPVVPFDEKVVV